MIRYRLLWQVVVVLACGAFAFSGETGVDDESRELISRRVVSLKFNDISLRAAVDEIKRKYRFNVIVNWERLKEQGVGGGELVHCSIDHVVLSQAMGELLRSVSPRLGLIITHNAVLITARPDTETPKRWIGLLRKPDVRDRRNAAVVAGMLKNVKNVGFEKVSLEDALNFVADHDSINVPVSVNWPELEHAGLHKSDLISLSLSDVRGQDMVYWIVHSVKASEPVAYVIKGGKLVVSSVAALDEHK